VIDSLSDKIVSSLTYTEYNHNAVFFIYNDLIYIPYSLSGVIAIVTCESNSIISLQSDCSSINFESQTVDPNQFTIYDDSTPYFSISSDLIANTISVDTYGMSSVLMPNGSLQLITQNSGYLEVNNIDVYMEIWYKKEEVIIECPTTSAKYE